MRIRARQCTAVPCAPRWPGHGAPVAAAVRHAPRWLRHTALEGTKFLYTGGGTEVIDIESSQGIADRIFSIVNTALEDDVGLVDLAVDAVTADTDRIEDEIERANEAIDRFRDQQLLLYANVEAQITRTNTLLDFLTIQANSIFNSS